MGLSPVENYYLDAGWGTWGFKATPITGKTMAELVASGGQVPDLIKPFALDRFSTFQQVNEMGATAVEEKSANNAHGAYNGSYAIMRAEIRGASN
ncbi:hypothetical protein Q6265_27600, partial [Klebsiella pneumoniae]|nr:hypothetical protein [Klebsiella pneumoniae]